MGQTPAKYFPMATPYGQSPDMGVLAQAQAAAPAPLNNFLPLNPQQPSQPQAAPQTQAGGLQNGVQNQFLGNMNRYLGYGGGIQGMRNLQ